MITSKINKLIKAGLAAGAIIAACPACTDTWDDHYDLQEGFQSTATSTLWEQIKANKKLTKFAQILEKATYYKDKNHPSANYTFNKLLNSSEIFTVFAPEDDAFTDFDEWMQKCETDGWAVQQQLLGNHIARWRRNLTGSATDSMTMLNNKRIAFDKAKSTFKGTALVESNIPAKNGTLHTINGVAPFSYNIYEYIQSDENLSELSDYFTSLDSTAFSPYLSTEGPVDANGEPTYVDSVYYSFNLSFNTFQADYSNNDSWIAYLQGINAHLDVEDSAYAVVLPNNTAYGAAYDKLKGLYNYAKYYINKVESNNEDDVSFTVPDTLQDFCVRMDMVTPLAFNINTQPQEGVGKFTRENFDANKAQAPYLLTSRNDTLRNITLNNPYNIKDSKKVWDKNEMFNNATPLPMSNGLAYVVDNWNVPLSYYQPDVIVNCSLYSLYDSEDMKSSTNAFSETFNNLNIMDGEWVNGTGKVHNEDYVLLTGTTPTTKPSATFQIKGSEDGAAILSGKYDVYVVIVPYFYQFEIAPELLAEADFKKNKFEIELKYNNGQTKTVNKKEQSVETSRKETGFETNPYKVDTVRVLTDFTFPYSYGNLRESYPTLTIKDAATTGDVNNNNYTRELRIDQILFVSKED